MQILMNSLHCDVDSQGKKKRNDILVFWETKLQLIVNVLKGRDLVNFFCLFCDVF